MAAATAEEYEADALTTREETLLIVNRATAQLTHAVEQLQDLVQEPGFLEEAEVTPTPDTLLDNEPIEEPGAELPPMPPLSFRLRALAGVGVAVSVVGIGVYIWRRSASTEWSVGPMLNRAFNALRGASDTTDSNAAADDQGISTLLMGDGDGDSTTIAERLTAAATFTANLFLSSVVTSVGEKARDYVKDNMPDVQEYVESAQEMIVDAVREPFESVQAAIEEQIAVVQETVQEKIDEVKEQVEEQVNAQMDTVREMAAGITEATATAIPSLDSIDQAIASSEA